MDPRLLRYYNRELQHLREVGGEFAREFPKIAGRLGLEGLECADPYVERLLEGFAFLAARVQLKIDAEFPRFTQQLLELAFPRYLSPTPSMAVVQVQPDLSEAALADGYTLPRDTVLRSLLGKGEKTSCEYRTAHEVTLWPLELVEAEYVPTRATLAAMKLPDLGGARAGIRLRLRVAAGLNLEKTALDRLVLYLQGSDELPMHLYEQLVGDAVGVLARWQKGRGSAHERVPVTQLHRVGFTDDEALLPVGPRSFQGYRLLHEYFAFAQRFLFVELRGLRDAVRRCGSNEMELFVLLERSDPVLDGVVDASNFALFCAPAINLFPRVADRIHLTRGDQEYHVVPDRARPMDFEVYTVSGVTGYGSSATQKQSFYPLYSASDLAAQDDEMAYYTVRREPRVFSQRQRREGPRSSYIGSEVFAALVDAHEAPFRSALRQIEVRTLCTNRDLPLHMTVGKAATDFTLEVGAPVKAVRCLAGPTSPRPSWAEGDPSWRLISHLTLNYLSLADQDEVHGAAALRDLLALYADLGDAPARRQIEGVRSVSAVPIVRRMPVPGPVSFGRGLEVAVTFDESAFRGSGIFLLGAVLEEFFARYVSLNSFSETVVRTTDRGEVMRWPTRIGTRQLL